LSALGVGSYVIYLSNDMIFQLVESRWLASAATAAVAFLSWWLFERRLIGVGRRLFTYGGRRSLPRVGAMPPATGP